MGIFLAIFGHILGLFFASLLTLNSGFTFLVFVVFTTQAFGMIGYICNKWCKLILTAFVGGVMIVRGLSLKIGYWPEGLEIPTPSTADGNDEESTRAYDHFLAYLLSIIVMTTLGGYYQFYKYQKP